MQDPPGPTTERAGNMPAYRCGPWATEFDKTKTCKECEKACTAKELIKSVRTEHMYHDAKTYEAALEFEAANNDPVKKEALDRRILQMDQVTYNEYATLLPSFICLQCEFELRKAEWDEMEVEEKENLGIDWPTENRVMRDAVRGRKGLQHQARGRCHTEAVQKVNEMYKGQKQKGTGMITQKRRKELIDEETNKLMAISGCRRSIKS